MALALSWFFLPLSKEGESESRERQLWKKENQVDSMVCYDAIGEVCIVFCAPYFGIVQSQRHMSVNYCLVNTSTGSTTYVTNARNTP